MLNVLFHWWKSVYPGTHIGEKFCICYDPVFSVVFVVEMIFDASFGHLHYHRSIPGERLNFKLKAAKRQPVTFASQVPLPTKQHHSVGK